MIAVKSRISSKDRRMKTRIQSKACGKEKRISSNDGGKKTRIFRSFVLNDCQYRQRIAVKNANFFQRIAVKNTKLCQRFVVKSAGFDKQKEIVKIRTFGQTIVGKFFGKYHKITEKKITNYVKFTTLSYKSETEFLLQISKQLRKTRRNPKNHGKIFREKINILI